MGELADDTSTATQNANSLSPHDENQNNVEIRKSSKSIRMA